MKLKNACAALWCATYFPLGLIAFLAFNIPCSTQGACLPPPAGLVSWWSGDDHAQDLAGYNHGSLRFGGGYADGKVGRGFSFNSSLDFFESTTWGMNLGTLDFSLVGWIKTTATKNDSAILMFDFYSPALYVKGPNGTLQLFPAAGTTTGGFNDGQFHHFGVSRKDGIVSYYKDGALMGTAPYSGNVSQNRFLIGSDTLSLDEFDGVIDEIAFFHRALTGSEIAAIAAAGADGMCKPPVKALPLYIEAEDFDFNGGQHRPGTDSMPYLGGAYTNLSAIAEIDYHDPGANELVAYRPASQGVAMVSSYDTYRDGFGTVSNFRVAYNSPGDWYNYTRVFPQTPRNYNIYARLSSASISTAIQLDEVVSGVGTVNQTLRKIGVAAGPVTGDWDTFSFVPVKDDAGNLASVSLGGQKTIRLTVLPGASEDINYLLLVPIEDSVTPLCTSTAGDAVAWWPGDGHPRDVRGTNLGSLKNGATYAPGKSGDGFSFDGVDDYVDTGLDIQPSAMPTTTWEAWVFPTRMPYGRQQILSADDGGYDRSLLLEGGAFGVFTGGGVFIPIGASPNQWQHVAVVYTPTNIVFYKNGIPFYYNAAPTGQGTGYRLQIGRNPGYGEYFQGKIDEVGIYNRGLTAAEIQAIYKAGQAGRCRETTVCPPFTVTPNSLTGGEKGGDYSQQITVSGGTGPYTFLQNSSTIPASLTLSSNGLLSGNLTATGQFGLSFRITDSRGCSQLQNYTLTVTTPGLPCQDLPPGMVSWWRGESNAVDALGANSGAWTHRGSYSTGKVGQAFYFDTVTNYLILSTNGMNVRTNDFTAEGWIKMTANFSKNYNALISWGHFSPALYIRSAGNLHFFEEGGSESKVGGFNDGQFHHFAVVRLGTNLTYYKDGTNAGTAFSKMDINQPSVIMGTTPYGNSEYFHGMIDEFSFYNRALNQTELQKIVSQGSSGKCGNASTNGVPDSTNNVPVSTNCAPSPAGLISGYPGENSANDSVGDNHGVPNGISYAAGKAGQAFSFDGVNDDVQLPFFNLGKQFTVELWFFGTSTERFQHLISDREFDNKFGCLFFDRDALMYYQNGNRWIVTILGGVTSNTWHHAALTYDGSTAMVFLNGVKAGEKTNLVNVTFSNSLKLGYANEVQDNRFRGLIDEVGIYNRVLTTNEIAAIFKAGSFGKCPPGSSNPTNSIPGECTTTPSNLISLWRGDDSPRDSRGTNHGMLFNGAAYGAGKVGRGFSFNTPSNYVETSMSGIAGGSGNFTVEGWIKAQPSSNFRQAIISFGGQFRPTILLHGTEGLLRFNNASLPPAGTGFRDGQFHHFAVVQKSGVSGTVSYYKDGIKIGTVNNDITVLSSDQAYIGWDLTSGNAFAGIIDELSFFNRDLADAEINAIFTAGSGGKCAITNSLLELSLTSPDFGYVAIGQQKDLALTISNSGNSTLVISNITASNPRFTIVNPSGPLTVATNSRQTLTLRFSPTAEGFQTGFLAISNNSAQGTFILPVRGIGSLTSRTNGGRIYAWGIERDSRFVHDNSFHADVPISEVDDRAIAGKTMVAVEGNYEHILALDSEGKVYAWGAGDRGQLGIGTRPPFTNEAVQVMGALAGKKVVKIATGDFHSLALTEDGKVYYWGSVAGSIADLPTPVDTSEFLAGRQITDIAAAARLSLALASDGKVYSWGDNNFGMLGYGITGGNSVKSPRPVGSGTPFAAKPSIAMAVSAGHVFALTADGQIYAWGDNRRGQLGIGSTVGSTNFPAPVVLTGALNGKTVNAIAAGNSRGMALTTDGRVYNWGYDFGELGTGDSTTPQSGVPVAVNTAGDLGGKIVVGIAGGSDHAMALTSDGKVYTWGDNYQYALGTQISRRALPVSNVPIPVDTTGRLASQSVSAMAAANSFSFVIAAPDAGIPAPEVEMILPPLHWGNVAPGETKELAFVITNSGTSTLAVNAISNTNPRFSIVSSLILSVPPRGSQTIQVRFSPTALGYQFNVLQIANTDQDEPLLFIPMSAAGAGANSQAIAWGDNRDGALGINSINMVVPSPTAVDTTGVLAGKSLAMVTGGGEQTFPDSSHSLALATDGTVYAWGLNISGQLGNGLRGTPPNSGSRVPVAVNNGGVMAGRTIIAVTAGALFSSALSADGQIFSWGSNIEGTAGNGSTNRDFLLPVAVNASGALAGKRVIAIASGSEHMLALTADGKVFAWGADDEGQLGGGYSRMSQRVPTLVTGMILNKTIVAISAGSRHNLALDAQGIVYVWGNDGQGGLGLETGFQPLPVPFSVDRIGALAGKRVVAISAGYEHNVALTSTGEIVTWGDNGYGQLGTGTGIDQTNAAVAVKMNGVMAGKTIVAIDAGLSETTLALASDGTLFSWGNNRDGQLGLGTNCPNSDCYLTQPVVVNTNSGLAGKLVIGLGSGFGHNLVLATPLSSTNTTPDIDVQPLSLNFGLVQTGQFKEATLVVSNLGSALLTVNLSNTNARFTVVSPTPPLNVEAGNQQNITIRFLPAVAGNITGNLTLTSNDPDEPAIVVALSGTGSAGPVPRISIAPTSIDFGSLTIGQSTDRNLVVSNFGGAVLTINSMAVNNPRFSVLSPATPFNVATGSFATVIVRFAPTATGAISGTVTFAGNDPNQSSLPIALAGTGTSTELSPRILFPSGHNFGSVRAGLLAEATLRITNSGAGPLTVTSIRSSNPRFAGLASSLPLTIPVGGTAPILIRVFPFEVGALATTIAIDSNDPTQPTANMALSVFGFGPAYGGSAFSWGENFYGQLGQGNFSNTNIPMDVRSTGVLAGKTIIALSGGGAHTLALTLDGKIYAWGANYRGQLGNGTDASNNVPVATLMTPSFDGKVVTAISAGFEHSLALTLDGKIYAWGDNRLAQLGDGSSFLQSVAPAAVRMDGALNGKAVVAIAAGENHSLALTSDGKVYAWGTGQLGNGGNGSFNMPVAVDPSGILSAQFITGIAAGRHSLALSSSGRVFAWGENESGQLGINSTSTRSVPTAVDVSGALNGLVISRITAGTRHSFAFTGDGKLFAWGNNDGGQLGIGVPGNSLVPVAIDVRQKMVTAIDAGFAHTLALTSDGQLYSWGSAVVGQLGTGVEFLMARAPTEVSTRGALGQPVVGIAAGERFSLAIGPVQVPVGQNIGSIPTSLNFTNVPLGRTLDLTLVLTNSGTTPLTISAIAPSSTRFAVLNQSYPIHIAAGAQHLLTVRFFTGAVGTIHDALQIRSNDPDEPNLFVRLSGTGIASSEPFLTASAVSAQKQLTLSWPASAGEYVLETTAELIPGAIWTPVSNVVLEGGLKRATLSPTGRNAFYRLRK